MWMVAGQEIRSELRHALVFKNVNTAKLGLDPAHPELAVRPLITALLLLLLCLVWSFYRVRSASHWGTSLGKRAFDLEVVDATTGERGIGTKRALKRWSPSQVLALIPIPGTGLLCYVAAFADSERRGLHDRVAGTRVQRTELRA